MRTYHKQKHLLENVNFHVNPLRVEIRNFNKHLTEEQLLISIWTYLTNQKDLLNQNRQIIAKYFTGPVYNKLKGVDKWYDLLDL